MALIDRSIGEVAEGVAWFAHIGGFLAGIALLFLMRPAPLGAPIIRAMPQRVRIDRLLVEQGLIPSRERAARRIMAGEVLVDGQRVDKVGALVSPTAFIELVGRQRFVSRGGDKLAHALDHFAIDVKGQVCLDVGASTGGFTDCLLQRGAAGSMPWTSGRPSSTSSSGPTSGWS